MWLARHEVTREKEECSPVKVFSIFPTRAFSLLCRRRYRSGRRGAEVVCVDSLLLEDKDFLWEKTKY